jgi:hypothetical protein
MRRKRQNCLTSGFDFVLNPLSNSDIYDSTLYCDRFDIYDLLFQLKDEDYGIIKYAMKNKGVFMTNYHGKIVYCNDKWLSLCKFSKYEVLNKTLKILQGKNTNMEVCKSFIEELYQTGTSLMENINYTNENEEIVVRVHAKKINFDNQTINQTDKDIPYFYSIFEIMQEQYVQ